MEYKTMLALNVAQLLLAPQGTTRHLAFDEDGAVFGEPTVAGRVRGEARLTRTGPGITVEGWIATALALECARCLAPVTLPVRVPLQEEFVPTVDVRTGVALRLDPLSDAFPIDAAHVLDLTEAVRQQVVVAAPLRPLCRPDCAGLCPDCGRDLNEGPCGCGPALPDSPFAALKQLLDVTPAEAPAPPARPSRRTHGRGPQA
jgi:uncharacterized protein